MLGENRKAATEMMEKYDPDLMGKIALALFKHHSTNQIIYKFDEEAESLYKTIFDKYNAQFNLKYSGNNVIKYLFTSIEEMWNAKNTTIEIISSYNNSGESKIGPQGALNYTEKDKISVCTKAPELLGRLTCVLWIYCNGKSY